MTKNNLDALIAFRALVDNKEYLQEIADENDISFSELMNYIIEHYISTGDVIRFVKEIKRKKKK